MELFKYCSKNNWLKMRETGCVRIGTLYDYRKPAKYGELTSDELEGTKRLAGSISDLNATTIESYPILKGLIHIEGAGKIGTMTVSNFKMTTPNLLVFSASNEYSDGAHTLWSTLEGYDCCYRIASPRLFFRSISDALGPSYKFLGFAGIHYSDEIDLASPEANIHPALVKRKAGYADQAEVRAIWQPPDSNSAEPIVLEQTRARLYTSEHRVVSNAWA